MTAADDALDRLESTLRMYGHGPRSLSHVATVRDELQRLRDDQEGPRVFRLEREARLAAEAEVRRLSEALEQIASDIHPARPMDEERPRWLDENSVWWNHYSPQEIARRALLAASPPDGETIAVDETGVLPSGRHISVFDTEEPDGGGAK